MRGSSSRPQKRIWTPFSLSSSRRSLRSSHSSKRMRKAISSISRVQFSVEKA